jgi:hypothetical protein
MNYETLVVVVVGCCIDQCCRAVGSQVGETEVDQPFLACNPSADIAYTVAVEKAGQSFYRTAVEARTVDNSVDDLLETFRNCHSQVTDRSLKTRLGEKQKNEGKEEPSDEGDQKWGPAGSAPYASDACSFGGLEFPKEYARRAPLRRLSVGEHLGLIHRTAVGSSHSSSCLSLRKWEECLK